MSDLSIRRGTRQRGLLSVPAHAHPLVRELFMLANEQKACLMEVERRAGLGARTIQHWRSKSTPNLTNFIAALNALGYELQITPSLVNFEAALNAMDYELQIKRRA